MHKVAVGAYNDVHGYGKMAVDEWSHWGGRDKGYD